MFLSEILKLLYLFDKILIYRKTIRKQGEKMPQKNYDCSCY